MQGANLCKRIWTAPELRKETCPIEYNFMGNAIRDAIMGVFHTCKSDHNYTV